MSLSCRLQYSQNNSKRFRSMELAAKRSFVAYLLRRAPSHFFRALGAPLPIAALLPAFAARPLGAAFGSELGAILPASAVKLLTTLVTSSIDGLGHHSDGTVLSSMEPGTVIPQPCPLTPQALNPPSTP